MAFRDKLTLTLVRENEDGTKETLITEDLGHVMILGEVYNDPGKMCEIVCQTSIKEMAIEIAQTKQISRACEGAYLLRKLGGITCGEIVERHEEYAEDPEDKLADQINGGEDDGSI